MVVSVSTFNLDGVNPAYLDKYIDTILFQEQLMSKSKPENQRAFVTAHPIETVRYLFTNIADVGDYNNTAINNYTSIIIREFTYLHETITTILQNCMSETYGYPRPLSSVRRKGYDLGAVHSLGGGPPGPVSSAYCGAPIPFGPTPSC
jgi:hypothetical protein